ncbi:MAG: zinc-ribbon domain-containing protein [Bacilli bacterium]|nr:zinc-ribbon domain-containing protein [Bacilli bacterium]
MTDDAVLGTFFAIFGVAMLIPLVLGILTIIGLWKTINKTGEEGWKSLIPVYNQYTLCTKIGVYKYWPLIVLGLTVLNVIPVIGSLLCAAGSIYFLVIFNVSLAKSFGKDPGFAVGLILLAPIFYLILGGKNSNYVGPNPMDDPVMKYVNENILKKDTPADQPAQAPQQPENQPAQEPQQPESPSEPVEQLQPTEQLQATNSCPNCGAVVSSDTAFCSSCGKQLK